MNNLLFIIAGMMGPWQILLLIIIWGPPIFVITYKRFDPEHEFPVWSYIFIYLMSLVPLGLIFGLYIVNRKKKYDGVKMYKYGVQARKNGKIIAFISVISIIFLLIR